MDGWLFSDECDNATPEKMDSQRDNNRSRTKEMYVTIHTVKCMYMLEKDWEMEEGARTPAAESGNDEDDHNMRRLSRSR